MLPLLITTSVANLSCQGSGHSHSVLRPNSIRVRKAGWVCHLCLLGLDKLGRDTWIYLPATNRLAPLLKLGLKGLVPAAPPLLWLQA